MTDEDFKPTWSTDIREAIYDELTACWQSASRVQATTHLNNAIRLLYVARCAGEERTDNVADRTVTVHRSN